MIFEHIIECTTNSHGSSCRIIGLCASDRSARIFVHFIDSGHVQCLAPIGLDLFYEIPIAVIDKLSSLSAYGNRDQAVLCVEGLSISESALHAGDHIAICIVGVTL